MKVAPLHRAFCKCADIRSKIVHTGQHHDYQMSGIFFEQLGIPEPDYFLGVTGGSHAQQTANIMLAFEKVLLAEKPDLVLVVGDVNSTLACALVAVKEHIPVAHVEAGLRSGDKQMPEEINRILTDSISDVLFVTEHSAVCNLLRENISPEKIHFTGNVMIDSLMHCCSKIKNENVYNKCPSYILLTLHRPANVDNAAALTEIVRMILKLTTLAKVVFPVHPRTLKNLALNGLSNQLEQIENLEILNPQGYLEFLNLTKNAKLVITDSGGIQEETTFLEIPCITLRQTTERPVTVEIGTNHLLPDWNAESVAELAKNILSGEDKKGRIPELWDGNAAQRIVAVIREKYINSYVCAGKRQSLDL
jgi:UDP-N-acetylglucosamine 2-epimerase (non-hydrolysing)